MITFEDLWNALAVVFICALVLLFIEGIGRYKLFEKAGERGWKAFIPILSSYILYRLIWHSILSLIRFALTFLTLFLLIQVYPLRVVGLVFAMLSFIWDGIVSWKTGKCFGKGTVYRIALILLHPIMLPVLGWGYDRYMGKD